MREHSARRSSSSLLQVLAAGITGIGGAFGTMALATQTEGQFHKYWPHVASSVNSIDVMAPSFLFGLASGVFLGLWGAHKILP